MIETLLALGIQTLCPRIEPSGGAQPNTLIIGSHSALTMCPPRIF